MHLIRLIILLIPFNVLANDVISEHNEPQAATQAARDRLYDQGCIRTDTTRSGRYQLIQFEGEYIVLGNQLKVVCVEFRQLEKAVEITWQAPATRADGSVLFASDIQGYKIYANGQFLRQTADLQETVHLMPGSYGINLTTVDKNGLESVYSQTVVQEVK